MVFIRLSTLVLSLFISSLQAAPVVYIRSGDNDSRVQDNLEQKLQTWNGYLCGSNCRSHFGWAGHRFGSDPFGNVLVLADPLQFVPGLSQQQSSNSDGDVSITQILPSSTTAAISTPLDYTTAPPIDTPAPSEILPTDPIDTAVPDTPDAPSPTATSTPPNTIAANIPFVISVPPASTVTTTAQAIAPQTTIIANANNGNTDNIPSNNNPPANSNNNGSTDGSNNGSGDDSKDTSSASGSVDQQNSSDNSDDDDSGPSDDLDGDRASYLKEHNDARAKHGASPLKYSRLLEKDAQSWADNCQFKHSGGKFGRQGENLAAGTGNYTIPDMVSDWVQEVSDFDPFHPKASHFTQVVWKNSTRVGCAKQTCPDIFPGKGDATFYVCEYQSPGNILGKFRFNVEK